MSRTRSRRIDIFGLAGALADMRTDEAEEEAIKLLEDAYRKRGRISASRNGPG